MGDFNEGSVHGKGVKKLLENFDDSRIHKENEITYHDYQGNQYDVMKSHMPWARSQDPPFEQESALDFILTNAKPVFTYGKVIENSFASDHYPVTAKIRFTPKRNLDCSKGADSCKRQKS